jgi:hypothetical protein
MRKEIFKISKKKKKLSNALEANRARNSLVRLDGRQCLSSPSFLSPILLTLVFLYFFSSLPIAFTLLEEVKEKISSYELKIDQAKEATSRDLQEIKSLKSSIDEQIHSVHQNITAIGSMGCGWEDNTKEMIKECLEIQNICLKSFSRWSCVWPGLSLWLSSEGEVTSSISALASQQGLIGEWVSLRAIACEIKVLLHSTFARQLSHSLPLSLSLSHTHPLSVSLSVCLPVCVSQSISDMSSKLKENQNLSSQNQTFKAALTTLRNKSKIDIENIQSDINELKQEVKLLEKQRRQTRSLLLDLHYSLQQDCDHTALKGKEIASSAQLELLELETAKHDWRSDQSHEYDDGMRRNTPITVRLTTDIPLGSHDDSDGHEGEGTMVSVVSSRRRDLETDNYYTGGGGGAHLLNSTQQQQQQQQQGSKKKKLLVDRWLSQLHIHLTGDLGKAIKKGLEVTDPHIFSPPSSSQFSKPNTPSTTNMDSIILNTKGNSSSAQNIVPFDKIPSPEINAWRGLSLEELRVSLTALECRSVWRKFQKCSSKYLSKSFTTVEAEWFHQIENHDHDQMKQQSLSPCGHLLRNGITISLPDEGSIRHTFPISREGMRVKFDEDILTAEQEGESRQHQVVKYPSQDSILSKGVKGFQNWQIFRRICLNAVSHPPSASLSVCASASLSSLSPCLCLSLLSLSLPVSVSLSSLSLPVSLSLSVSASLSLSHTHTHSLTASLSPRLSQLMLSTPPHLNISSLKQIKLLVVHLFILSQIMNTSIHLPIKKNSFHHNKLVQLPHPLPPLLLIVSHQIL